MHSARRRSSGKRARPSRNKRLLLGLLPKLPARKPPRLLPKPLKPRHLLLKLPRLTKAQRARSLNWLRKTLTKTELEPKPGERAAPERTPRPLLPLHRANLSPALSTLSWDETC